MQISENFLIFPFVFHCLFALDYAEREGGGEAAEIEYSYIDIDGNCTMQMAIFSLFNFNSSPGLRTLKVSHEAYHATASPARPWSSEISIFYVYQFSIVSTFFSPLFARIFFWCAHFLNCNWKSPLFKFGARNVKLKSLGEMHSENGQKALADRCFLRLADAMENFTKDYWCGFCWYGNETLQVKACKNI